MRETMYIKGQNQLERFLENEGADPFFIENISYYEFRRCESQTRLEEGIPLHVAKKYYSILKELSDFMKKISIKYDLPSVTDLNIDCLSESIYVDYRIEKGVRSAIFKFKYKCEEEKWYLYSVKYKHTIGYYHHITVEDDEGLHTNSNADCFTLSTNKITDKLFDIGIDSEDIMNLIHNEISFQIGYIVEGLHKIADDIDKFYK